MAIRTSFEVAEIVTRWEPVNTVDGFIQRRSVKMGSRDIGVVRVHVGGWKLWLCGLGWGLFQKMG